MTPIVGQTEDGYSFVGGDPSDKNNWKQVGVVEDGYSFKGGDPSKKESWSPVATPTPVSTPVVETPVVQEPKSFGQNALETLSATTQGVGKSASFGFADELSGAVGAAIDPLVTGIQERLAGVPEDMREQTKPFGERYKESRDFARKDYEQTAKESPIASTIGEIGGAVGTGLVGGTGKLLTRAAIEGGAYGLGESQAEDIGGMAVDTAKGAGLGLGTAGLVKGAGTAYNKILKPGAEKAAERGAGRLLETTPLDRAKLSQQAVSLPTGDTTNAMKQLPEYLKKKGFTGNLEELATKVKESTEEAGKTIGNIAKEFDSVMSDATASLQGKKFGKTFEQIKKNMSYDFNKVADDIETKYLNKIKGSPNYSGDVSTVSSYIKELRDVGAVDSLEKLNTIRKNIDNKIGWSKMNPSIMDDIQKDVRRSISTHVKDVMLPSFDEIRRSNIIKGIDKSQTILLKEANAEYTMASHVNDLLKKASGRADNRRVMGLTDNQWALGGVLGSAAMGSPAPLLAPIGKMAMDYAAPKVGLYAPEIVSGVKKVVSPLARPAQRIATQQGVQGLVSVDDKVKGTKYEQVFQGLDQHQKAVRNNLLNQTDEQYRTLQNSKEDEEETGEE